MLIDRGNVSEGVIFCRSPASRIRRTTTTGGYIIGPHVHEADLSERDGSQNRHSRAIATFILGLIPKLVKRSQNRAHTLKGLFRAKFAKSGFTSRFETPNTLIPRMFGIRPADGPISRRCHRRRT